MSPHTLQLHSKWASGEAFNKFRNGTQSVVALAAKDVKCLWYFPTCALADCMIYEFSFYQMARGGILVWCGQSGGASYIVP